VRAQKQISNEIDTPLFSGLLDIAAIVRKLNTKPTIHVESGMFIAHLDGQEYVLGKTEAGIQPAVRKAIQLCREDRLVQEIAS
jgi:hypothetical protein